MMPGINSRQMQQMMKQMGVQQVDIPAERVEIVCNRKRIVIEPCQVSKVKMLGQETWQISGNSREESLETKAEISDEDVQTVAEQANVSLDEARKAIKDADGDLADAILKLKEE